MLVGERHAMSRIRSPAAVLLGDRHRRECLSTRPWRLDSSRLTRIASSLGPRTTATSRDPSRETSSAARPHR